MIGVSCKHMDTCNCCKKCKSKVVNVDICSCLKFGCDYVVDGSLYDSLREITETGASCLQVCVHRHVDQYNFDYMKLSPTDVEKCTELCERTGNKIFVHAPVDINLGGEKPQTRRRAINSVNSCLQVVKDVPSSVIAHIGTIGTIEQIATNLNENILKDLGRTSLLLENSAGQGNQRGRTWDELRHLREALDDSKINLVLDTAHTFASGMSSLSSHEDVVKMFDHAESTGWKIPLIHLNDSKSEYRSRVDRHENLGRGYIWGSNADSLISLLRRCKDDKIFTILETPDPLDDLGVLSVIAKRLND